MSTHFDAVNKIWSGPKTDYNLDKHQNFGEIVLKYLNGDSNFVMQVNTIFAYPIALLACEMGRIFDQIDGDTGETLTKAEIRIRTIRCAQRLTELGCTQSDRIGVIARNHHNLTPLLFGAFCIGTPIFLLHVTFSEGMTPVNNRSLLSNL